MKTLWNDIDTGSDTPSKMEVKTNKIIAIINQREQEMEEAREQYDQALEDEDSEAMKYIEDPVDMEGMDRMQL